MKYFFWKNILPPNPPRPSLPWRPVYTGDFCCDFRRDFLLLNDVKELISYKCSKLWNVITTSISNLLLPIVQKEKIALKIAAKIAGVNELSEPLNSSWMFTSARAVLMQSGYRWSRATRAIHYVANPMTSYLHSFQFLHKEQGTRYEQSATTIVFWYSL